MAIDYQSHPAELVPGGKVASGITVKELRDAIPAHCWKPSYSWSLWYLVRDLMVIWSLMATAFVYIPELELSALRYAAWIGYGYVQGLAMTGLWVLGHECGHSAFSKSNLLNNSVGWILHSALLTPYFSWRSTHRRHHIYANNLAKDHNFVPPMKQQYATLLGVDIERLEELTEDSPAVTLARIVLQQIFGFPWYLVANITSSVGSLYQEKPKSFIGNSHFLPSSTLFRPEEAKLILASDIGIGLTITALWYASSRIGFTAVFLLYLQPYMWVNHWIVAITYLHHTHPDIPKYEAEAWTFLRGALATVDREFGWVGKHMLHNIVEFHVIHHLFSRIPQYHAEEATKAIMPLLGKEYHDDKKRSLLPGLWEAFTKCQYVEPDKPGLEPKDRVMIYRAGPSPPIEFKMKARTWLATSSPQSTLLHTLANAESYETWIQAAYSLDDLLARDLWRQNPCSKSYDYRLIYSRLQAIISAREDGDVPALVNLLRSGLVRNLGNITTQRLFNVAYAGTKLLIEDYITQVALALEYVANVPGERTIPAGELVVVTDNAEEENDEDGNNRVRKVSGERDILHESDGRIMVVDGNGNRAYTTTEVLGAQAKLDLLHDSRQAFGRSTLVLQGGAMFGMCHLGVVKALHLRGLLPRIITGTATGALVAALVGIHTEEELLGFLNGEGIDLSAFALEEDESITSKLLSRQAYRQLLGQETGLVKTVIRRAKRYWRKGHFLDAHALEDCVRANVGDLTFEEAYARTKRVLNITVATSGRGGVPNLLNYLTAPNVLIWSAALASNASTSTLASPELLQCKDETGAIIPWASAQEITFRSWRQASYNERDSPLSRIAELFNVNHFVVSQARPYIAPFVRSDMHHSNPRHANGAPGIVTPMLRLASLEVHHRLNQLDSFGLLPISIRRLLIDETIPGAGITLVPHITPGDYLRLLEHPTKESLEYWILRGERSVWPAVSTLKIRCAVEVELDRAYQIVRRRKPSHAQAASKLVKRVGSRGTLGKRRRAQSVGQG
ncbi:hypothetical protein MMC25_006131 [Agyrium rufum]|nr:hypothetical protein [Agyrium rufum]